MTYSQLLFSFKGRIPRSALFLKFILPYFVLLILMSVLDQSLGLVDQETGIGTLYVVFSLLGLYPSIAVYAKRCHDRNRSGWFILVFFIPLVNLWPWIETWFLKGTDGDNQYGSDPLADSSD